MSLRASVACALALFVASPAHPAAPPVPRVDALGDPLPAGALARLGTTRFRQSDQVNVVAISPDGKLAAGVSCSAEIHLWEVPSGKPRGILRGHREQVGLLAFSPDGRQLVSTDELSSRGEVRLWDVAKAKA